MEVAVFGYCNVSFAFGLGGDEVEDVYTVDWGGCHCWFDVGFGGMSFW